MDMHQVGKNAEWAAIAAADRTYWQRLAHSTNGFVTPGNMVSVCGLILVLAGLVAFAAGSHMASFLLVGFGRLADILDGIVAHRTHTKSPVGESVDATIDKLELAAATLVLLVSGALPAVLFVILVGLNGIVAVWSAVVRFKGRELHPVRTGKYATFMVWAGLGCIVGANAFQSDVLNTAAIGILYLSCMLYAVALVKYVRNTSAHVQSVDGES